jgi:polyphosphate kinase
MERNLNRRVEVCFPIEQPELSNRVLNELELYLQDGRQRWELLPEGIYVQVFSGHQAAQLELLRQFTAPTTPSHNWTPSLGNMP